MPRAVQPDLLLDRGDPGDVGRQPAALVAAARDLERDVGAEAVVERARDQPAAGERASARRGSRPGRRSAAARAPRRGRRRRCRCAGRSSSTAIFFCSSLSRWTGLRPITPGTAPSRVCTSTRWPTRICASQPPIGRNQAKPFSSTWVIVEPDLVDVADDRDQRPVARRRARGRSRSRSGRSRARRTRRRRATPAPPAPRSPRAKGCAGACREALERPPLPRHTNGAAGGITAVSLGVRPQAVGGGERSPRRA